MALKVKGKAHAPKAGPKRRRAKSEEEAIREAIEEHGKRGKLKITRTAGKVNSFSYKEVQAAKQKRARQYVSEQERMYATRTPNPPSAFDVFKEALSPSAKVFAVMYWRMQCAHKREEIIVQTASLIDGSKPDHVRCKDCGLVRKWHGTKTETKYQEWIGYCPDGYDMFEWGELFTRDRSMWQFIHDECQAEMVESAMIEEVA